VANFSDLQPDFAAKLAQLRAALTQEGISNNLVSGYRSPEYQGQMYANHQAKMAGQPLPYPGVEAPSVVAAPWASFHNYGLATDFNLPGGQYARLGQLAPQYGLSGIGSSDPGHIQMGGSLANDIAQYHLANWRPAGSPAPATGAIAYAGPSATPSRPGTPGTTLYSSPLDIVLQRESGDRNINNTTQGTSSGQAQGNAQITTGTWNDFAPKAGIDLKMYPTPDSAPRNIQIQVANTIPLNRWASSTVNAVLAKYPGIDTSQPLGVIQSQALKNGAAAPTTPAAAPAVAGAPGAAAPAQGGLAGGLKSATDAAKPFADNSSSPPPQFNLQPAPGAAAAGGPMMLGPGGQNPLPQRLAQQDLATRMAQYGISTQPMVAGASSFTPTMGMQTPQGQQPMMQPGAATGMPSMPGTTLNSPSQLQMAMMSGSLDPYSMYARPPGS
jgi:hypothetical protein